MFPLLLGHAGTGRSSGCCANSQGGESLWQISRTSLSGEDEVVILSVPRAYFETGHSLGPGDRCIARVPTTVHVMSEEKDGMNNYKGAASFLCVHALSADAYLSSRKVLEVDQLA